MTASTRRYASLLAKKCFLSPNPVELEALLGLKLDIDWSMEATPGKTLTDLALMHLHSDIIFRQWWKQLQAAHPNTTPWSMCMSGSWEGANTPYVGWAIRHQRHDALRTWLAQDQGSVQQWEDLTANVLLRNWALTPEWNAFVSKAPECHVPPDFINTLTTWRNDNLWLSANSRQEYDQCSPATWTPEQALVWWQKLNKNKANIDTHQAWRGQVMLAQKDNWLRQWNDQQWENAWAAQAPGLIGYYCPDALQPLASVWQNKAWSATPAYNMVAWNEVQEMLHVDKSLATSHSYTRQDLKSIKESKLRSWANNTSKKLTAMAAADTTHKYALINGLLHTQMDTTIVRTTMFSSKGLSMWQHAVMPDTAQQALNEFRHNPNQQRLSVSDEMLWLSPPRAAALLAHVVKTLEKTPAAMQTFVDSCQAVGQTHFRAPAEQKLFALNMVPWALRGMDHASSLSAKEQWAHLYWGLIFEMDASNQHHWLKKASRSDLHVPLRFWDEGFQKKVEQAIVARRKTKDIHTTLQKMLLLQQVATVVDVEDRATLRPTRKM